MSASATPWSQFICRACGVIYDEKAGDPDSGIAPGTRFEDIPDDWVCPLCGVVKADFEPYEPVQLQDAPGTSVTVNRGAGVIIVGAGIAGWSAAEALRALDAEVPITIVTACRGDRYHKPELSVALSRGLQHGDLVRETAEQAARRLRVQLMSETFVVGLSPSLHQLRTTRGTLRYTKLILAVGAKPALPPALPASLCWRVNDLAGWSGLQQRLASGPQRVAIVGAGMIGCELAEDLARCGHSVLLIDRQEAPLSALLPPPAAQRLGQCLASLGVQFLGNVQICAIAQGTHGEKLIRTAGGEQWLVDEVVAATGLVTDMRLARIAGLAFDRGIVVDPVTLRTSDADIHAMGDCISLEGIACRFIEPIARQASAIAHAVLGQAHGGYEHMQPVIRLKTRALPIVIHGQPCTSGEWRVSEESDQHLYMLQWLNGRPVATLQIGRTPERVAA